MLVCNTDQSNRPGKHWLLFYFDGRVVEMFDSLGRDVGDYDPRLGQYLRRHADEIRRLTRRVQPEGSDACGHYCLYYAYMRCRGNSMRSIVATIPSTRFVRTFVKDVFDIPASHNLTFQSCVHC